MTELSKIQKEIEARNIQLGKKLLAYDSLLKAVKTTITWLEREQEIPLTYEHFGRMKEFCAALQAVVRKAEGEMP